MPKSNLNLGVYFHSIVVSQFPSQKRVFRKRRQEKDLFVLLHGESFLLVLEKAVSFSPLPSFFPQILLPSTSCGLRLSLGKMKVTHQILLKW